MTAITRSFHASPHEIRPFDVRRDLRDVARLVELCFADTLDAEGRRYIQQMHAAADNPGYLHWAATVAGRVSMPLTGFVWESNGDLAGNLSLIPFSSQGKRLFLIANVAVDPAYRQRGIARQLTESALEHIRKRGAHAAWLHVRADNQPADHLYRSLGFEERARRSTWETDWSRSRPVSALDEEAAEPVEIGPRRAQHWPEQLIWMRRAYPPVVTWHLPLDIRALRPGLRGILHRLFTGAQIKQFAATSQGRLLGVMVWQSLSRYTDSLWLAAPPRYEDAAIRALLPHVCRVIGRARNFSLDYPAGRGAQSLEEAGFKLHQTLVWMELNL
ncbi:MAG: GNAT family N-acetyltransferase [Acidimicrobiia bacterium]